MALRKFQFTKEFVEQRCDYCGRCFAECPVLRLPLQQAQDEIRALIHNLKSPVLTRCTGCMACNAICPQDANPHTLIVSRWHDRYVREGLPYAAGLLLPYQEPNLYTVALQDQPESEQSLVRRWEANWRNPPRDEMIYAGCNILLQPFLMDSALYSGVPIFGSLKLCCGEPFYRMGCREAAKAAATNVKIEFERMGLRKVIVPCLAGYHLFKYVYPEIFDIPLDVEVIAIEDWLYDRITAGELKVAPLNKTAVIHDNCWPKASGEDLFKKVRGLLGLMGIAVIEPKNTRENALCCGMCAGAAQFRLRDIFKAARQRLDELERSGADIAINYCGGCNWLFSLANQVVMAKYKLPQYHLLEVVQLAAGETPKHRADKCTRGIIRAMTPRIAGRLMKGGRFWINDIGR